MKIAILVEGKTETGFKPALLRFLKTRLSGRIPTLDFMSYDGRIPKREKLRRKVENLLNVGRQPSDAVIALTDVYTGTDDFTDAADAKQKMREWVGNESRFHPHTAQHDFEAWLLPYWSRIQELARHNKAAPTGEPEQVNHLNPPSRRIAEVFRIGARGRRYIKARDAIRILRNQDLTVAAGACPELKALLNTILGLCQGTPRE